MLQYISYKKRRESLALADKNCWPGEVLLFPPLSLASSPWPSPQILSRPLRDEKRLRTLPAITSAPIPLAKLDEWCIFMCAWDMIVGLGCALDGSSRCLPAAILQNRTMGGKKKQIVPLRRLCHRFDYARRLSNGKFSSPVESRLDRRIPSTQFSFFFFFFLGAIGGHFRDWFIHTKGCSCFRVRIFRHPTLREDDGMK